MIHKLLPKVLLLTALLNPLRAHEDHNHHEPVVHPPGDMETIGDSHGEIAVSENGDIYVSVLGGPKAGIQVYDRKGKYLRNVPNAPADFHGFTLLTEDNQEVIYGAGMETGLIAKINLQGELLLQIKPEAIPAKYQKKGTKPR